mmetsp:Transcript_49529/g.57149  ORF Transcript_49529/g.57149 Transcript_49529/m.57149 type:complete len:340 (+) Transcript_49529:48-1067(+)
MKVAAVIGATGYVGSHIVQRLINCGYTVRCGTRSPTKAAWLFDSISNASPSNLSIHVTRFNDEGPVDTTELDALCTDCDSVFFCAGFEAQKPETISFMVTSVLATLAAAKKNPVPSTVVLTSSGGSTNPTNPPLDPGTLKNERIHWSDPDYQQSVGKYSPAAKTLMELQAFAAVGRNKHNDIVDETLAQDSPRLCILNPNLILGPQLQPGPIIGNSLPWIGAILKGETMNKIVPNDSMSIIDVRDLAALHVLAAESSAASGRYFGVNRSWPWKDILEALAVAYPPYRNKMPPMYEEESAIETMFDNTRRDSLLGNSMKLRSLEETFNDLITFMKEKEVL